MVYVSKRFPASTKTTSLSKPWESIARTQRRRERACDGSPSRKTNWPVLRISALSRDSIPVVMPGWRSRGRLLPRRVWYSIWSSGSLRSSESLHFRLVRRRLPGGRREARQPKTLSSSKPQLGQVPSKTSLIFLGLICCFDRTRLRRRGYNGTGSPRCLSLSGLYATSWVVESRWYGVFPSQTLRVVLFVASALWSGVFHAFRGNLEVSLRLWQVRRVYDFGNS